jgi:hypothetical protein
VDQVQISTRGLHLDPLRGHRRFVGSHRSIMPDECPVLPESGTYAGALRALISRMNAT